jgi:hypothetical protein
MLLLHCQQPVWTSEQTRIVFESMHIAWPTEQVLTQESTQLPPEHFSVEEHEDALVHL